MTTNQNVPSTTETLFGFTPEEARAFEAEPHTFRYTEEELLNHFSPVMVACEFCGNMVEEAEYTDHILRRHPEEQ
jgi:hypothetical protein